MNAREIIDANRYMVLGTSNAGGVPWASPVWFAQRDYREFFWVSRPETRHSRNLAERPQLAIAIFDSTVEPYHGQAVYISATAEIVEEGVEAFSAESLAQGMAEWTLARVTGPAHLRLYRPTASEMWTPAEGDVRDPVQLPRARRTA